MGGGTLVRRACCVEVVEVLIAPNELWRSMFIILGSLVNVVGGGPAAVTGTKAGPGSAAATILGLILLLGARALAGFSRSLSYRCVYTTAEAERVLVCGCLANLQAGEEKRRTGSVYVLSA